MFDADGVLFDSTESNVAYYNWIFEKVGEPPLDRDEEISAISYAASEVFAARARGDAAKLGIMHDVTRNMDEHRILWAAEDIIENRPALSRWHPDYKAAFAEFMKTGSARRQS